ncbi:TonB-dependent receptor domain-containing protein [Pedobacter duraquae]|uniref:Outer membrane receptor protein involved in Fe transport n=1 Tax=Pedobacter duraquae TaxID=425511 RepID=A0A4R6IGA4_9SPHI|nr:TonB-dependent receptor [Pedobacter duraquae]TDO19975.1 outer membrane receptor protein involved in Fe transport [Pedobacter duraquae]
MNISAKMRRLATLCVLAKDKLTNKNKFIRQLMRVSVILTFLTLTTIQVMLATASRGQNMQQDKVTIGLKGETLQTGLKKIEQQTSLRFYYRKSEVKAISNLHLQEGTRTIAETLQELLNNTFFTFRQIHGNILLEQQTNQVGFKVNGRVLNIQHQPLSAANINIFKKGSNKAAQTLQADTSGYFKLSVAEKGDYVLVISSMGMDEIEVAVTLAESPVVSIPDIILSTKTTQLQQVSIVAKRPFIEQRIDRTIVNVNGVISNTGANALEVLSKSPGVQVDDNGTISFRGKNGILVLIDGKPSYLSGDNLANYLRSMQASSLDQIELMSNPPAKYEAAGNGGVINIKTRKSKAEGFNGNITIGAGKAAYWRTNENLNLNYAKGAMNMFASAGYNLQNGYRKTNNSRQYLDEAGIPLTQYEQVGYSRPLTKNPTLKFGLDYRLSEKTTVGFLLSGSLSTGNNPNSSTSTLKNQLGQVNSIVEATNYTKSKFNNGGLNLNYSHAFDEPGKVLSFDLDYLTYSTSKDQTFDNRILNATGSLTSAEQLTAHLPAEINIFAAKTDFVQPLGNKAKLELGLKSSYVNTDNAANYYNVVGGVPLIDYNQTNRFKYRENINAGYASFNQGFGRVELKAGLRLENTNISGHQLGNVLKPDSSFTRSYLSAFPTAYLSYKIDTTGNHLLIGSYGRRIDRPYYQNLNPFLTFIDKFGYWAGNPFLRPQFSDNYELSWHYKNRFSFGLQYNLIHDYQVETVERSGDIFISRTVNIGKNPYYGIDANATLDPFSWWNMHIYAELINNITRGPLYGGYLNTGQWYVYTTAQNQFQLGAGWSAELSGFFISAKVDGQYTHKATGQLDAGLQKKIMAGNGTIRLGGRDLLRTNFPQGNVLNIPNTTATWRNDWAYRTVSLGFTYNFGNSVKTQRKATKGSAESEQNRVRQ